MALAPWVRTASMLDCCFSTLMSESSTVSGTPAASDRFCSSSAYAT